MITTILLAALTALAMERYNVLPSWYYRISRFKPLSCQSCLAFWSGFGLSVFGHPLYYAPFVGLASAALAIIIIKLTE
jgi:hypothetical protein